MASCSNDNSVKIWDNNGKLLNKLEGYTSWVTDISITSNEKYIVSSSIDKMIKIWDLQTSKLVQNLEGHEHWVLCVSLSPNGDFIASGSRDKKVKIWNINTS